MHDCVLYIITLYTCTDCMHACPYMILNELSERVKYANTTHWNYYVFHHVQEVEDPVADRVSEHTDIEGSMDSTKSKCKSKCT